MSHFDDYLNGPGIPLHEAANFFIAVKRFPDAPTGDMDKAAGWQDPPDETGELEGKFDAPVANVVEIMGRVANHYLRLMIAGDIYQNTIRGPHAFCVSNALSGADWDNKGAFENMVAKMTTLMGAPHIPEPEMPPVSTQPIEVAKRMIRAEQETIQALHELEAVVGQNPLKGTVSKYMGRAQEHIGVYRKALPDCPVVGAPVPEMGTGGGLAEHEEQETPEQEAQESPEFEAAEQAVGVEQPEKVANASIEELAAHMAKTARALSIAGGAMGTGAAMDKQKGTGWGETIGTLGGGLGGSIAGAGIGGALGAGLGPVAVGTGAAGSLAGGYYGGQAGGYLGRKIDQALSSPQEVKQAAARMAMRVKLAQDAPIPAEAPMASPTDQQELAPTNYLQAEAIGRQLQDQSEAEYHKAQKKQMEQQVAQLGQQMQMAQQQLMQVQQEAQAAQQQVQQTTQQAVQAHDEALKQTQTAANMRMGMQKMRAQMLQVASQDPAGIAGQELEQSVGAAQAQPPQPGEAPTADPAAPPQGPAGQAPAPQAAPGAAPPAGAPDMAGPAGGPPGPPPEMAAAQPQMKMSSAIGSGLGALVGGAQGVHGAYTSAGVNPQQLQGKITQLQQTQDGTYARAAELAKAKKSMADTELAVQHPHQAALRQGAAGAIRGAIVGGGLERNIGRLVGNLR